MKTRVPMVVALASAYIASAAWIGVKAQPAVHAPTTFSTANRTLCDLLPAPAEEKPKEKETEKESEKSAGETPYATPSEIDALIRENKLAEASAFANNWASGKLATLEIAGQQKAGSAQDPAAELREMISIDKTLLVKYADRLTLQNFNTLNRVNAIYDRYAQKKTLELYKAGKIAARAAPAEIPEEVHEIIRIGKQAALLGSSRESALGFATEIVGIWADTLGKKLFKEGKAKAILGGKEPPPEAKKMLEVGKQAAFLGLSDNSLDRTMRVVSLWGDSMMAKRLRAAKPRIDAPAPDAPIELEEILEAAATFASLMPDQKGKMEDRVKTAANKWFSNHVKAMGGRAVKSGVAKTPAQIDSIIDFAKANNCLDASYAWAIDEARKVGETNFHAYKDKLPCKPTEAQKDNVKTLAADLQAKGWGPYETDLGECGWQGRITITSIRSSQSTEEHRGGGDAIRETMENEDTLRVEVNVSGETGAVTISGDGAELLIRKRLVDVGNGCGADSLHQVTRTSHAGSATIPVEIKENFGGRFTIRFPNIDHRITREETLFVNTFGSKCPRKGGTEVTNNVLEMKASQPGKMILTEPGIPIPASKRGMILKHREVFEFPGARTITEYDLKRIR